MDSFAHNIGGRIDNWLELTARSLRKSFQHFWPSDAAGRNDPCEQNVAIHLAHVLLREEFSVFAEVRHHGLDNGRIDLLAIEPDRNWFLAFEFKKVWSGTVSAVIEDLAKLNQYRLPELCPAMFGKMQSEFSVTCQRGVGLAAGLLWVPPDPVQSSLFEFWGSEGAAGNIKLGSELTGAADALNSYWATPQRAWKNADSSRYYLVAIAFDIPASR